MSWIDYDGGGIFVSENTWLLDFSPELRLADLDYGIDPGTMNGYIILRSGNFKLSVVDFFLSPKAASFCQNLF